MLTFTEYMNKDFLTEAKKLDKPLAYLYHAGYGFTLLSNISVWTDFEVHIGRVSTDYGPTRGSKLISVMDVYCVDGSKQEALLKKCGYERKDRFNDDTNIQGIYKREIESMKMTIKVHANHLVGKDIYLWKPKDEYAIGRYIYEFAKDRMKDFSRKITFKNG